MAAKYYVLATRVTPYCIEMEDMSRLFPRAVTIGPNNWVEAISRDVRTIILIIRSACLNYSYSVTLAFVCGTIMGNETQGKMEITLPSLERNKLPSPPEGASRVRSLGSGIKEHADIITKRGIFRVRHHGCASVIANPHNFTDEKARRKAGAG